MQLPTHRGTAQLYVDNQLVGSTGTITGAYLPINSNDSALLLANNNGGAIDQLAFYDKALTAISEPAGSGNWPQPTAADALKLLRELGYSLDTQTPNPGAIVGGVTKHWAVRNVNPNDAVQATFSSSYDASSGSWTTARPLNPSLAVKPTTLSYSTGGPVQDPLIINLSDGNVAIPAEEFYINGNYIYPAVWNVTPYEGPYDTLPGNLVLTDIKFIGDYGTDQPISLTPDQVLIGGQSLAAINPQSSQDNLNYVIPTNLPEITVLIPRNDVASYFSTSEGPKLLDKTLDIFITTWDRDSGATQTWAYSRASLSGSPQSLQAKLPSELSADNAAIATAPLVAQAPLQLKYIDSGISLSSASTAQAANTPAVSSPANSFGQSQVIGSFSNAGVRNGWLAIAQPFSTNATSNPAGRIWIQYTGQSSNGNPSSTTAQAPSTWLNALANSNFSPDSPNLPLLHDSTYPSSVGGLLIQADPSDGWGQNFGQTMQVADLDQDGKQDLIIAAPQANGGGQVVIIAGSWIAANLTTAGATTTLNLSNLSGLGSAVTVLTPGQPSASSDDISVAGFGSALAVDTSTSKPTLWIGAPNYLRQLDANNTATPLVSLQPVGAVYSWQNGQIATALAAAALGYGGTVTSPQPNGTSISGSSTSYWGSQLGAAIATDGTGKIAISAPGVMASLLYSGTEVAQAIASGKTKPKAPDGDGALVQIQLPSVSNPNVSTTQGLANPALIPVATKDSVLAGEASTAMQNLKALQVNNIAQATQANNQAIQSAPVGAVYLFNSSADLSGLSQIDAQSTATTSNKGATFYGPNSWNTLGATGFGSSLSFGDFTNTNSDSVLAIGAPQTGGSGAAYLVDTSQSFSNPGSNGWLADLNLGSNQYLAHLASGLTLYGAESADNFGNGLLNLGDTNQDGYDDLLVQAFNAAGGAGNGYVLFGSDQLIQYSKASSSATSAIQPNPASGSVAMGSIGQFKRADDSAFNASILSELGSGLSGYTGQGSFGAGDANGDGLNDIPLGSGTNGKAYLTWGHPYLESINSLQLGRLTSDTGYLLDGMATTTPNSLQSIGDFNGDGYDDFLSILPSGSGGNGFTTVRIELGAGTQQILAEYNANFYSFLVNSGTQLWGAGDLNGDGYSDIALAPGTGQTWGAGIASGILYGRSSSDLPVGSSFGLVAPVDGNSTPQSPLPTISPGGSTDATPAVVAVGQSIYSVVKANNGTDLYFNQSLDGGLSWGSWINLTTTNSGFSTNTAPTLAWFNNRLVLGFLNTAQQIMLASWDPASGAPEQWSSAASVVPTTSSGSSALTSNVSPLLLASDNTLQLIWVDPATGKLNASSNNSQDPSAAQPTNSWTAPVTLKVSTPNGSGGSTLLPITATAAPTGAWLGSTPVLGVQQQLIATDVHQTLSGFLPSGDPTYENTRWENISSLNIQDATFIDSTGTPSVTQAVTTVIFLGNSINSSIYLLVAEFGNNFYKAVEIEVGLDSTTNQVTAFAGEAGYWEQQYNPFDPSSLLPATEQTIQNAWLSGQFKNVPIASSETTKGYGLSDLVVGYDNTSTAINLYTATLNNSTFTLATQFQDTSSNLIASAPALTTTPTGLVLTYVNLDGSVSLNRLDVLDTNGVLLAGVQVNSNGVVNTSQANLQWQSTLLNASNGNLPAQRASVPVSVDEGLLLMNINASGSSTANQVWLNAVPPLNNPDSILWQTSALSRPSGFGDLNGDGRVDQFSSAGNNAIYTIPGMNYAVWDIRPAGDVNGNGHDDVLLVLEPTAASGPAYGQSTTGQPGMLQTVLLDGTLFHVDASNTFSLVRASGSATSGWTASGLKAPLNPRGSAELYDLASTTNLAYKPLLQNWIEPIQGYKPGAMTSAKINDQVNPIGSAASSAVPSAAVGPDGKEFYIVYCGNAGNGGIWIAYQDSSGWPQVQLPTSIVGGTADTSRSPSAVIHEETLYIAYADTSGNIHIAFSNNPTDTSTWSDYQISNATITTKSAPTLLAEPGRLALYYPAGNSGPNGGSTNISALYSRTPTQAGSWGGSQSAGIDGAYTGSSTALNISVDVGGGNVAASVTYYGQIAATLFQGRPVLAFNHDTGGKNEPIIIATPVAPGATEQQPFPAPSWQSFNPQASSTGVGLTSDNSKIYLTWGDTNESGYGRIGTFTPSNEPGAWDGEGVFTLDNNSSTNTFILQDTFWNPFIRYGNLGGTWIDNKEYVRVADIATPTNAPAQQSLAGYSIDGNLDTNGDGFADLLISDPSDPSKGVDNQYVLFGGDYLDLASQVGTPGDDVMQGTALADVIYSLAGSDLVLSNGGADVILTGTGDDQIGITGNSFHRIDAGAGFDQLLLRGDANQSYDFQLEANQPQYFLGTKLKNIELISSLNYGSNTLSFDLAGVNASNPDRILFVTPDSSDSIVLSAEFQRDSKFDTSFQGSLWSAYAAQEPGSPAAANPALLYVLNPEGASADGWLDSHVSITGTATPLLMSMRMLATAATSPAPQTPTTAEVVSSTPLGDGLVLEALRSRAQSGVARFRIRRNDTSRNQLLIYNSISANGTTEPGREYNPVLGVLRMAAGVSSQLITVPLVPQTLALHRTPSLSLKVREIKDEGQREAHLILHPDTTTNGHRPVLSGLDLTLDSRGTKGRISLRADTISQDLNQLQVNISQRNSADSTTTSATRRLLLSELEPSVVSTRAAGEAPLPYDSDGSSNGQVTAQFVLDLEAGSTKPLVALAGPDPIGSGTIAPVGQRQVRFEQDSPLTAWRSDTGSGQVTFTLTAGTRSITLIEKAVAGSSGSLTPANALATDPISGWLATERKAIGSRATINGESLTGLAWTPTAQRDGVTLSLQNLRVEASQITANFSGGVSLLLWQATGSTPAPTPAPAVVDVQRLAGFNNSLGFYPVDSITGSVDGLNPGDSGYLGKALARAEAAGLLLSAQQLPAFGQSASFSSLPIDSQKNYGVLVLQNGSRSTMFSSFATANPDGKPQMIRLGSDSNKMVIGVEDISVASSASDHDYNDMIINIRNASIPIF